MVVAVPTSLRVSEFVSIARGDCLVTDLVSITGCKCIRSFEYHGHCLL